MKNKFLVVLSVFMGIFTFISCASNTEKGVVYELSLHQYALKKDSISLHQKISAMKLDTVPIKLREKINFNKKTIDTIHSELLIIDPPIPFPPFPGPNPCPTGNCNGLFGIQSIVLPKNIQNFGVVIKNSEGKIVGGLGEAIEFEGNPTLLQYPIEVNATGNLIMEVTKFSDILDSTVTYQVNVQYPRNKKT